METRAILLIEDNAEDQALITRAFRRTKLPFELLTVNDGQEALDFICCTGNFNKRRPTDLPELILLDLDLPKINGLEVLQYIRADQRMRIVPVVILTASADESDRTAAYRLGANSYIVKPGDGAKFGPIVAHLCQYWFGLNTALHSATLFNSLVNS